MEQELEFEYYDPESYKSISDKFLEFEEEPIEQEEPTKIQKSVDDFFKSQDKRFMIIKNYLFQPEIITVIKPLGFSILTYLIYESKGTTRVTTTMNIIAEHLYIKTKATIIRNLENLIKLNLITLQSEDINLNKIGANYILKIDLTKYYSILTGHETIYTNLYENYYHQIGEISWTIFCYFKKICFGKNKFRISQRAICESTGIGSEDTIHKYIQLLIDLKIISKIDDSKSFTIVGNYYEDNKPILYRTPIQYQFNI